jgi:hypothetical protein
MTNISRDCWDRRQIHPRFDPSASNAGSPSTTAKTSAAFFVVKESKTVARVPLLSFEAGARVLGIGHRLYLDVCASLHESAPKDDPLDPKWRIIGCEWFPL